MITGMRDERPLAPQVEEFFNHPVWKMVENEAAIGMKVSIANAMSKDTAFNDVCYERGYSFALNWFLTDLKPAMLERATEHDKAVEAAGEEGD